MKRPWSKADKVYPLWEEDVMLHPHNLQLITPTTPVPKGSLRVPGQSPRDPQPKPTHSFGRWGRWRPETGREHIEVTANTSASWFPAREPSRPLLSFLTTQFQSLLAKRNPLEVWGLKSFPVIQKLPSVAEATFPTLGTGNSLQSLDRSSRTERRRKRHKTGFWTWEYS